MGGGLKVQSVNHTGRGLLSSLIYATRPLLGGDKSNLICGICSAPCRPFGGAGAGVTLLVAHRALHDPTSLVHHMHQGCFRSHFKNTDGTVCCINCKEFFVTDMITEASRQALLEDIRIGRLSLSQLSDALRKEREVVLEAVKVDPDAFQIADKSLAEDQEIVLKAVKGNGLNLQFAGESLRNNPEIVMAAVTSNGMALQFASESLKRKLWMVLAAVRSNGVALQFADESLRNNPEIVKIAVDEDVDALQFAHKDIQEVFAAQGYTGARGSSRKPPLAFAYMYA